MAFEFLSDFFNKIGHAFKSIFNAAQRTWDKINPEVQKALLWGSGVIAVINKNRDAAPPFVIEIIKAKFPGIDLEKIRLGLIEIAKDLNIAVGVNDPDLLTLIQHLQAYLGGLKGKVWANISQTLGKGIAAFLAPPETKFAAISALIEFVYQSFIKKQIETDEPIQIQQAA